MRRLVVLALVFSFAAPPVRSDGLLRRIFGGGRQVQAVSCHQQQTYYQPQYYQPYQVVAAVPLATVPVAIDLQQYMYSVNATAFQSFREYQQTKVAQQATEPATPAVPHQSVSSDQTPAGAAVLAQNCIQCHQAGRNPKAGFTLFAANGQLNNNLPWQEIMERITAEDPALRMPPKKTLASHDIMAIFRQANSGITDVRTADNGPSKLNSPFD